MKYLLPLLAFAATGCVSDAPPGASQTSTTISQQEPLQDDSLPLRMPIHGVMIGIVDFSAFGVLESASVEGALSDSDWRAAGLAALNLIGASTLMTIPGTGPNDARWTADPLWKAAAAEMQRASVSAAIAVRNRDRRSLSSAATSLSGACQSCHTQFRDKP